MTVPLRLAIRADQSRLIGTGHVRRCLSLASALRRAGADVTLVTRRLDEALEDLGDDPDIAVRWLDTPGAGGAIGGGVPHAQWAGVDWQRDAADTAAALTDFAPNWVIVDHYSFDARWQDRLATLLHTRIAAIDDLADRDMAAELLIDHNWASDHKAKYQGRIGKAARIAGGPRFALLGPSYRAPQPFAVREKVGSIGIFMGGVDAANMSAIAYAACRDVAKFSGPIEIVATSANPHLKALQSMAEADPDASVLIDLPDLAAFFARHDLQIGAGGGASWERCCIGVPAVLVAVAQNQMAVVPQLAALGIVAAPAAPTAEAIGGAVAGLMGDKERRAAMSAAAQALVDGRGAERVALRLCADRLDVRAAAMADADIMHRWRNHPATRAVSLTQGPIPYEDHVRWLKASLGNADRLLLMAHVGAIDVGVIRFDDLSTGEAEVSLYLDPALHGLGLGKRLLLKGEEAALRRRPKTAGMVADILENNPVSCQTFAACGYALSDGRWRKSAAGGDG